MPGLMPYPGGDALLTRFVAQLAPTSFRVYAEPFVGGGSVAVEIGYRAERVLLGDADPFVANAWACMLDPECRAEAVELAVGLEATPRHFVEVRDVYAKLRASLRVVGWRPPPPSPTLAALELYTRYLAYNATREVGGTLSWAKLSKSGWPGAVSRSVDRVVARLAGKARVCACDYRELLGEVCGDESAWVYLDPPHHNAPHMAKGWYTEYADAWGPDDFRELVRGVGRCRAKALLKYTYDEEVLRALVDAGFTVVAVEYYVAGTNHTSFKGVKQVGVYVYAANYWFPEPRPVGYARRVLYYWAGGSARRLAERLLP